MTAPSPTRDRARRLLLLQLLLWPALLVGAELGHRGWLAATGDAYEAEAAAEELRRVVGAMTSDLQDPGGRRGAAAPGDPGESTLQHPYTGFGPSYLFEEHAREMRRAREGLGAADEYRILLLGGSVAAGFGDPKSAGAREFERVLKTHPDFADRPVYFLRQGIASYKQPQQLLLTAYLLASGVEPHAVVNLDGFNEVALALGNAEADVHPGFPAHSKWAHLVGASGLELGALAEHVGRIQAVRARARRLVARVLDHGFERSSLVGRFALARLRRHQREYQRASEAYVAAVAAQAPSAALHGPRISDEVAEDLLPAAVSIWEQSSRSLDALCRGRGIAYLHVLQPTLHDEGSKTPTPDEVRTGRARRTWLEGAGQGYPLLREAGERLRADGIAFCDASGAFRDVAETLYYDACHFNQRGNAILGRAVGEAFLAAFAGEAPGGRAAGPIQGGAGE